MNRRSFLKALACIPLLAIAPKLRGLKVDKGYRILASPVMLSYDGIETVISRAFAIAWAGEMDRQFLEDMEGNPSGQPVGFIDT